MCPGVLDRGGCPSQKVSLYETQVPLVISNFSYWTYIFYIFQDLCIFFAVSSLGSWLLAPGSRMPSGEETGICREERDNGLGEWGEENLWPFTFHFLAMVQNRYIIENRNATTHEMLYELVEIIQAHFSHIWTFSCSHYIITSL